MAEREHKTKNSIYAYPHRQTDPICQQKLKGCRPTFDHNPREIFIFFSVLHLVMGILAICLDHDVKEYKMRYDDKCGLSSQNDTGSATVYLANPPLNGNLFFYFEIEDYYQTFFMDSKKYSLRQLREYRTFQNGCNSKNRTNSVFCDIIDRTFFRDTYEFLNANFSESNISWRHEPNMDNDTSYKSKHPRINQHFVVWMRIAAHPHFRKLYARSVNGCPQNLSVKINCYYSFNYYKGKRYIVLVQPSGLGGKSWILAIFNFILFAVIVVFIVTFEVSKYLNEKNVRNKELHKLKLNANSFESTYLDSQYP